MVQKLITNDAIKWMAPLIRWLGDRYREFLLGMAEHYLKAGQDNLLPRCVQFLICKTLLLTIRRRVTCATVNVVEHPKYLLSVNLLYFRCYK